MVEPERETIPQLLGRRLREEREAAGLRQEDIARIAVAYGFKWGRSSVAALEAGTRKVSAEELLMLPLIAQDAGLRSDSLIRDTDVVVLTEDLSMWGRGVRRMLLNGSEKRRLLAASKENRKQFEDAVFAQVPTPQSPVMGEFLNPDERLRNARFLVDRYASVLLGVYLWPQLNERSAREAVARSVHPAEVDRKVASKIDATPTTVSLMAQALWGRSLTEERDRRAAERGNHDDARARQGARGFVTRELTRELEEAWKALHEQAPKEFRTKAEVYRSQMQGITMHYHDAGMLELAISNLAHLASEARGESLCELPEELRYIFGSNPDDDPA